MTRYFAALILAVLLCAAPARAETRPNLTGTWKQNNEKSTPSRNPGFRSYLNKIEHKDPDLRVVTITARESGESTYERTYTTDAKEQKRTDPEGDEFTTTVKWQGTSLVFETVEKERGHTLTTRETWTLSADGKTLTKTIHRSGPQGESDQKYVLEKQ